jgi:pyrroline-5-carboxylate reductase
MYAFLGAGKLAEAVIRGGLVGGSLRADQLLVSARSAERKTELSRFGWEVLKGSSRLADAHLVILGVRHFDMPELLKEYGAALEGKPVLSLAVGVTMKQLSAALPKSRIMRALPNTPAQVREAVTLLSRGSQTTEEDVALATKLFKPIGKIIELPETLLDTANAVSGAGPTLVFAFVEAFLNAAKSQGLPAAIAEQAVIHTLMGAATMLMTGASPKVLLEESATPGGSSRAELDVLSRANLKDIFVDAIAAGRGRAEERNLESDVNFAAK